MISEYTPKAPILDSLIKGILSEKEQKEIKEIYDNIDDSDLKKMWG